MGLTVASFYDTQYLYEVKKYSTDFGDFIPTGGSVVSASANYAQTFGGTASGSCVTSVTGGSIVTFVSPALSVAGTYTYSASATLTDGQVRRANWYVTISA